MEDVEDARELVEQRMRATGMEESIFDRILGLLEGFDSERESVIGDMLDRLEASGWADLRDRWQSGCQKALASLESLEEGIVDALDDSEATAMSEDELMAAVGPRDFLAGETKVWTKIAEGDIPDMATLMGKLLETDIEVIKKCEEDLKKVRDDDKVVEALIQKNFGSILTALKDLVAKYSLTGAPRLLVIFMKDASTRQLANEKFKEIEKLLDENYTAAKQKRVVRQTVLDNIDLLNKAREQLSEEWIDQLYSKGESAAKALRDAGRSGDYEAADWEGFGQACIRALAERRDAAKEQSRKIFGELLPTFIEENTRAFAALTDDPATLEKFTSELKATFETIDDRLEAEEDYKEELADGPYKQAVGQTLAAIRQEIEGGLKLITDRTDESDKEVKR
ncbi:MAG TPA: hypothetical protein VF062_21210 [Candidatus Limnocylindrales bacterium]